VTFNDQYLKHLTILILTTCFRKQIFPGACSGDSRTSIIRPPPALLPRPRAQPWQPASWHTPWLNWRPNS
jgi:hypothetical protein